MLSSVRRNAAAVILAGLALATAAPGAAQDARPATGAAGEAVPAQPAQPAGPAMPAPMPNSDLLREIDLSSDMHMREELGVNAYTTPSIEKIFQRLERLGPLPVGEIKRRLDAGNYSNRIQLALNTGNLIAEGFITVQTQDRNEIEDIGRKLLKKSQALGVSEQVTRHSKKLIELGLTEDWMTLRTQLNAAQSDVEEAMLELRDEQIAHMIGLGGWLRGLEVATETIQLNYTEPKAAVLLDLDLIDYFTDRLDSLHPALKQTALLKRITIDLKTIGGILQADSGGKVYPSDVGKIHTIVAGTNDALARPVDDWPDVNDR